MNFFSNKFLSKSSKEEEEELFVGWSGHESLGAQVDQSPPSRDPWGTSL